MNETDHDYVEIRRIAYRLWLDEGQPIGRDRDHWKAAKEMWVFQMRDADEETASADGNTSKSPMDITASGAVS